MAERAAAEPLLPEKYKPRSKTSGNGGKRRTKDEGQGRRLGDALDAHEVGDAEGDGGFGSIAIDGAEVSVFGC